MVQVNFHSTTVYVRNRTFAIRNKGTRVQVQRSCGKTKKLFNNKKDERKDKSIKNETRNN